MKNKTETSQITAIPKAQTKSKGDPLETKGKESFKKVAQWRKNRQRGPFRTVRFFRLRLKSKNSKGTLYNNLDAFPGYSFSFL